MVLLSAFLLIAFTLSLLTLYILVRHDFVLARKSLLLQEIFDNTFFSFLFFIFLGRLFYVLGEKEFYLIHPIRFFHLVKFPGIIFLGGAAGFFLSVFLFFGKKKILTRVLDIYSISLYPIFAFALFTSYLGGYHLYFMLLIFILSLIFLGIGIYSYKNYLLKDGSVFLLFICLVCVFTIVSEFSDSKGTIIYIFNSPQILSIIIFFASSGALLVREGMIKSKS